MNNKFKQINPCNKSHKTMRKRRGLKQIMVEYKKIPFLLCVVQFIKMY